VCTETFGRIADYRYHTHATAREAGAAQLVAEHMAKGLGAVTRELDVLMKDATTYAVTAVLAATEEKRQLFCNEAAEVNDVAALLGAAKERLAEAEVSGAGGGQA